MTSLSILVVLNGYMRLNGFTQFRKLRVIQQRNQVILILIETKTGANERVTIIQPLLVALLARNIADFAPDDRVFDFAAETFRLGLNGTTAHFYVTANITAH